MQTKGPDQPIEAGDSEMPLFDRFSALRGIPRAELCALPSPVELLPALAGAGDIWVKRDDLNAPVCGGNKVRALEFLLGGIERGDSVVTVGGEGSTHVLSTAVHAARLGATTTALRWRHDMNPVAELVASRIAAELPGSRASWSTVVAMGRAKFQSITSATRYIPLGGSTPLGVLGHVNAALELAGQIAAGRLPRPDRIVLPLGSGGTTAGFMLGFAIAGIDIEIVGARVGPGLFVNRRRVLGLARRTARLIEQRTGERLPILQHGLLRIVHDVYGGAYGRPLAAATKAARMLEQATGIGLDGTYSAKAFAAALDESRGAGGPTLFWLTFDARCLTN
ncbi:MAG: pyridoxal-phosphate dependent enzyme [Gemmatimonadaceae bacterium]